VAADPDDDGTGSIAATTDLRGADDIGSALTIFRSDGLVPHFNPSDLSSGSNVQPAQA
jgi:hypothetical protein